MFGNVKGWSVLVALVLVGLMDHSAAAETVEIAKKCNALTAKAFPPRVPGNPAAGSAKGSGQAQREFYKKCVANGGKMNDDADKGAK
jgi:hypothetical protein